MKFSLAFLGGPIAIFEILEIMNVIYRGLYTECADFGLQLAVFCPFSSHS